MNALTPSDGERGGMLPMLVLSVLIDAKPDGLDTEQVAREAKRDYDNDPEREEITTTLDALAAKNLICRDGDRWRSLSAALETRAFSV